MSIQLPKLKKVDFNRPKKKKILLLSDDLRLHSGVGTMSKEIVLNTCHKYDWVQIGGAIKHPDQGKRIDLSTEIRQQTGVDHANVVVYPTDGYGNAEILRQLIKTEKPDAVMHFTDPRFWGWLYNMEHELRQTMPLIYYNIWDDLPYPHWNEPFYESCDLLMAISKQTYNINPYKIEQAITTKTKAIVPVSLYGQCADFDRDNDIASKYSLPVIEDGAQSFGATYKNKKSCNLSKIGCTSFFPSKPLGCYGDGGAIFTSDDKLAKVMSEIRLHGQSKRYVHTRVGVGGRMDTLQCAIVLAKLENFDWEVKQRISKGWNYNRLFGQSIETVKQREDRIGVFGQYTIFVNEREIFQNKLKTKEIPTAIHYPVPMHLQPAYESLCCPECCPEAEKAAARVISLPMDPYISEASLNKVVDGVLRSL